MLDAMRQLALDALWVELDGGESSDPEVWYQKLRAHDLGRLFPKLVEDVEQEGGKDKQRYYTLRADPQHTDIAVLQSVEFREGDSTKLPFNQASGPQAPALGPVIKRTAPSKAKEAGPTVKIQQTTLKAFGEIADAGRPWSPYFRGARECFLRPKIETNGQVKDAPGGAFQAAIRLIEEKRTVLLAFQDELDRLPGEVPEYVDYLQEVLAKTKYATAQIPACEGKTCSLCGHGPVKVYPKAPNGAGINLANLDRDGAFPGLDSSAAWKGFALCVSCADLLYVYCKHVADDYRATIAGHTALVIPMLRLEDLSLRKEFIQHLRKWIKGIAGARRGGNKVIGPEGQLLKILGESKAVVTLTILWAEFGQRIDDIQGVVTDILPCRLQQLSKQNLEMGDLTPPTFPSFPEEHLDEFAFDLSLSILKPLLRRPGGKAAEKSNQSRRLFDLRRDLAEAIYHGGSLPERFFDEIHETARWHFDAVCDSGNPWGLLNEGRTKDGKTFLTIAGWVRQLARFLHYLKLIGVMPMPDPQELYQPTCEVLKPYFGVESAIRGPARAFAFILGALFGKLLQVQAARKVNVGANALTWLKRLTLSGKDLPGLYIKTRSKLLEYESSRDFRRSRIVREVEVELTELQRGLGTQLEKLEEVDACYFLLLGQAVATKIMPSKKKEGSGKP